MESLFGKRNEKDPANIGDLIKVLNAIPKTEQLNNKILYGKPDERPQPYKLKGFIFIDYITPTAYLSIGTSWVNYSSGLGFQQVERLISIGI